MTTRVTNQQTFRVLMNNMNQHRVRVDKYSNEVSTGVKVHEPGDSKQSGAIARFRQLLDRYNSHEERLGPVKAQLDFQDNILSEVNNLVVRAKEIATQAANETNGTEVRFQMASEVYAIRDHLASLANSTYQGRYIFGGADDDDPPYNETAGFYDPPSTTPEPIERSSWVPDVTTGVGAEAGQNTARTVKITDDMTIQASTPAGQIFNNAIFALEKLGRSLRGYDTTFTAGAPDGGGAAYNMPNDYQQQTQDIADSIEMLDTARESDIMPEIVSVAGRLHRMESARSTLDLNKTAVQEALARIQEADIVTAATELSESRNALEASMSVTGRILGQSILDFL